MSGVHLAKETAESFASGNKLFQIGAEKLVCLGVFWCPACLFPEGGRSLFVAGSVGPYGAFLNDCSEYTGAYAEAMSVEVSCS